MATKTNP